MAGSVFGTRGGFGAALAPVFGAPVTLARSRYPLPTASGQRQRPDRKRRGSGSNGLYRSSLIFRRWVKRTSLLPIHTASRASTHPPTGHTLASAVKLRSRSVVGSMGVAAHITPGETPVTAASPRSMGPVGCVVANLNRKSPQTPHAVTSPGFNCDATICRLPAFDRVRLGGIVETSRGLLTMAGTASRRPDAVIAAGVCWSSGAGIGARKTGALQ